MIQRPSFTKKELIGDTTATQKRTRYPHKALTMAATTYAYILLTDQQRFIRRVTDTTRGTQAPLKNKIDATYCNI